MNTVDFFERFTITCDLCKTDQIKITVCPSGVIGAICKYCGNEEEVY